MNYRRFQCSDLGRPLWRALIPHLAERFKYETNRLLSGKYRIITPAIDMFTHADKIIKRTAVDTVCVDKSI